MIGEVGFEYERALRERKSWLNIEFASLRTLEDLDFRAIADFPAVS